jgi:hypothetical protein
MEEMDRHGFHSQTTHLEFDSQGDCFSLRFWQPALDSLTRLEEVRVYVAYTVYGVEYGREKGKYESLGLCTSRGIDQDIFSPRSGTEVA